MYYKIQTNIKGKDFDFVVKILDDKYWICVYYGGKNDFFVRKELISDHLLKGATESDETYYNTLLDIIKEKI